MFVYFSEQVSQLKDQLLSGNEEIRTLSEKNEAALVNIEQMKVDLTRTKSKVEQERVSLKNSVYD